MVSHKKIKTAANDYTNTPCPVNTYVNINQIYDKNHILNNRISHVKILNRKTRSSNFVNKSCLFPSRTPEPATLLTR
jgi:hypothetical protein